jgi:ATP-binding cassette, subfamily B, bacterial MsbA
MIDFTRKLWDLVRPYRARLALGVFTGILAGFMPAVMIASIALLVGIIFPSPNQKPIEEKWASQLPAFATQWLHDARLALENGLHDHRAAALGLVVIIPLVMFLRGLVTYLNIYFLQWVAIRTVTDLRVKLFGHLLNLSAGFFNQSRSGELISRIMSDTTALQVVFANATSVIIRDPVTLVSVLTLLLWRPETRIMTLISIVVLPVCLIPLSIFSKKVRRSSGELQNQTAGLIQVMAETFTGHRVVKAYNLENVVTEEFRATAGRSANNYMRIVRANEITSPIIDVLGATGVAIALVYMNSQAKPATGDFVTLILSVFLMYPPMKNLARLHNQVTQARAASARVFELLDTKNSVPEPAAPKMLHANKADIVFENVDFNYGEKTVLHDINLNVSAGQLVAFVGKTGSGKTTLANLLLRFYDPTRGAIKIGGVDLREFSTRDLRNQIAVVAQENILFNDTIRRNIELGRPGATNEEIVAAARFARADEFILQRPEGFDTVIGEKGIMLSGGQRQRLAIARAMLKNAPILILDEATNALDAEVERQVQAELDELMKGRTTFCIAHRLSTIIHADLIVVLEQGRIVETGTHPELSRRGGVYQKLYELFSS